MKSLFLSLFLSFFLMSCSSYPLLDNVEVPHITQPELKPVPALIGQYNYKTEKTWKFYFTLDTIEYRGEVPKGWISDGTSVPRAVWTLSGITRDGLERGASWEHDWSYTHVGKLDLEQYDKKTKTWSKVSLNLSREQVDNIFYRGMIKLKVGEKRSHVIFDMVRRFGYIPWNAHSL